VANTGPMNRFLLAQLAVCCPIPLTLDAAGGDPVVLQGVDRYRVLEPCNECVRIVLGHRGETYSPAYIQGIAGTAFQLAGPCVCAPTCGDAMQPDKLLRLFGYEVECLWWPAKDTDSQTEVAKWVERVKAEIRAGRPAIMWHVFTNYEWDVVAGFDDEKHVFLGRGSYAGLDGYASADQMRAATCDGVCPLGLVAILVGEKTGEYDPRAAEIAALRYAVRHAHSERTRPMGGDPGKQGLRGGMNCYQWWAQSFRTDPAKVPDGGDRYPLSIYRSTHRAAGEFMLELAAKYPEAARPFTRAAGQFAHEADALDEIWVRLMERGAGWQDPDPAKSEQAAALFDRAARHYAQGIRDVERGLAKIAP